MIKVNKLIDKYFPANLPIVFLHAHPDDEAFLSAGLINELVGHNRECYLIYCAASLVTGEDKTFIRQAEAKATNSLLRLPAPIYLEYCESKYTQREAKPLYLQNDDDIANSILNRINQYINGPFCLVSYDKNGGYGNKDHIKVNKAAHILKNKNNKDVTLYEITINRDRITKWLNNASQRLDEFSLPKLSYWSECFGLSEKEIDLYFELSKAQLALKKKALAANVSQLVPDLFPMNLELKDFKEVFGNEYLHITKT